MRRALLAAFLVAVALPADAGPDPSRDVLWAALKTCVLAKRVANRTFPCLSVDLGDADRPGSAVLRAPGEPTHIVVMPTNTVAGLEAPVLRGPAGVAYWRAALAARPFVTDVLNGKLPLGDVGLAVNSAQGRSQDQLHIHLDCLKPSVLKAVRAQGRHVHRSWSRFPVPLAGDRYYALRVPETEAAQFNPFAALRSLPGARPDLHRTSFAAVATPPGDPEPGFILLAFRAPSASAEDVMDHTCTLASGRGGA